MKVSTIIISEKSDERVNQYFKDGIEYFDDCYPCMQRKDNEGSLFHVYYWIQFFVSVYKYKITNNNNHFE